MAALLGDRRRIVPLLVVAVAIAVGAFLVIVLSSDASSSPISSASSAAPAGATKVDIQNFMFGPGTVNVKAGSQVTWTNSDSAEHTATASGAFDTGTLNPGDSKTVTLSKPGTYSYACSFHPFMHGTVVVK